MRINIVNIEAIKVAALEHLGEPETLEKSVESFRAWRRESGCSPVTEKRTFGVAYSDPEARPLQSFRFDICGEVDADIAENSYGVMNSEIPAGRCARVRHTGSYDTLHLKVKDIYRSWLPATQEIRRDAPIFFEYLNFAPEVSESELVTDIYFPLR
ncbi:MAG: GyrI-like domain-containing protein [Mariprofundaceae bacterium]|nr:GyrI-like domain-containing protein [Mariprofundaceae bacterium]